MTPDQDPDKPLLPPDDKTERGRLRLDWATLAPATKPEEPDRPAVDSGSTHLFPEVESPTMLALKKARSDEVPAPVEPLPAAQISAVPQSSGLAPTPSPTPWTLQQFFNGEIDLDVELIKRFPGMPLMSTISFRSLGAKTGRGVATLTTADGGATLIVDADAATHEVQLSFTYGSMLTLRFGLDQLGDMDRQRWLDLMRREQGGLAFLWGQSRWEEDYLICIARKYHTNVYAFSPRNFDAAIRLTPEVTRKLLNWLEEFWKSAPPDEEPPKLLTW